MLLFSGICLLNPTGYQEFDFPPSIIPLSEHPYNAHLTVEDSVYYAPNATAEWHTLFPSGDGFVRLGPNIVYLAFRCSTSSTV